MSLAELELLRVTWLAKKLCYSCGEPCEPGHKLCAVHLEYQRTYRRRIRRERRAAKLCIQCGKRLSFKSSLCVAHYLLMRERQK